MTCTLPFLSASTLVIAAVSVVFPWSMWPMVPTLTWGLFRSNFSLAMALDPLPCDVVVGLEGALRRLLAAHAGDDLFLHGCRRLLVDVELHRVRRATLGPRTQVGSVPEHLRQRARGPGRPCCCRAGPCRRRLPRRELRSPMTSPMNSSGVTTSTAMIGSRSTGLALRRASLKAIDAGDLERHLGGVDVVVLAVGEHDPDVDRRVAGEHARVDRLLDAGVDGGDVLLRDAPAGDLVDELVAAAGARRLEVDRDLGVLARATGLLLVGVGDAS